MNIKKELEQSNMPLDSLAVVGSGILQALSIRDTNDIDIIVTSQLFDQLRENGWEYSLNKLDEPVVSSGVFEAFTSWSTPTVSRNFEEVWSTATIIDGIAYLSLSDLLAWKQEMMRPKDIQDITLITDYMQSH